MLFTYNQCLSLVTFLPMFNPVAVGELLVKAGDVDADNRMVLPVPVRTGLNRFEEELVVIIAEIPGSWNEGNFFGSLKCLNIWN